MRQMPHWPPGKQKIGIVVVQITASHGCHQKVLFDEQLAENHAVPICMRPSSNMNNAVFAVSLMFHVL